MARPFSAHPPLVLAFGVAALATATRAASDGYPPFDIERISALDSGNVRLRITLAVAGFCAEQIEIVQERGQIVIRGRRSDERERQHLYRGIAARQFQRVFLLGEAMRVESAILERGLLLIELAPPEPGGPDIRTTGA